MNIPILGDSLILFIIFLNYHPVAELEFALLLFQLIIPAGRNSMSQRILVSVTYLENLINSTK